MFERKHKVTIILKSGAQIHLKVTKLTIETKNAECVGYTVDGAEPRLVHLNPSEIAAVLQES